MECSAGSTAGTLRSSRKCERYDATLHAALVSADGGDCVLVCLCYGPQVAKTSARLRDAGIRHLPCATCIDDGVADLRYNADFHACRTGHSVGSCCGFCGLFCEVTQIDRR